jgi:hypothetical protein
MLVALQAELRAAGVESGCSIEVVDVDADEALTARYDELVPVLLARKNEADPVQLCHYFLDAEKVRALLAA